MSEDPQPGPGGPPGPAGDAARNLKELEDLRYALDQSAIVAITDVRGSIRYVNDKFCDISKYPRVELLGQDHRILNSGHHPKDYIRTLWHTIAGGEVWRGELRNRAKDGSIYWVDTTIVPFLNDRGKPYQYLAIRYDITARKQAEALLVNQASLARLGEMAAVVAHEVRNPLAGLRGALQILSQRLEAPRPEHPIILEMIKRLDVLNNRVEDLLRFAKPRTPQVANVPLMPLVEGTIALLRRDPAAAGLAIAVSGDARVVARGDAELMREVLLNLLLNASQATDGRGAVRVEVGGGSEVTVRITDDGAGLPADLHERVFEPFFTTKSTGTGLGLAIVRRLIELQHGTVRVETSSGRGTTMVVSLPAGHQPPGPRPGVTPASQS
jgi:PAS domain S-box-containing protein